MLHPEARIKIFEEYDVDSWDELVEQEAAQLYDSIQPVHCTVCGEYITDAEPDACDHVCPNGCGNTGEALTEILLTEVA
jgi:ferredoxin